ncbi:hypothetical protein FRUB_00257 [Fimbriiglobus ruber]|uniref:Uncharacterized protein n=1 Tax=Fimbriiglobus ruber TaxID=1908690 RepID=A0A225E6Y1_9BACT|nr:hypothetical protein FRUB_00257 [Fimbriiglobus ruber]
MTSKGKYCWGTGKDERKRRQTLHRNQPSNKVKPRKCGVFLHFLKTLASLLRQIIHQLEPFLFSNNLPLLVQNPPLGIQPLTQFVNQVEALVNEATLLVYQAEVFVNQPVFEQEGVLR